MARDRAMRIETERLVLRDMALTDLDDLLAVFADPETMRFYPQPFDCQMTQAWIARNLQRYAQDGFGLWAVILKTNGALIGDCGLVRQEVEGVPVVEIGYHIRRDFWGQGLATEAAQACRDYGWHHLGLDQLVSLINPANIASRRVAEKNGMRLIKQVEWHGQLTCVYAVERGNA